MQPREQILSVWRHVVDYSYRDGIWHWAGRVEPNSISDAELLLCILYPATNVPALRFDRPDQTAPDVLSALRGLGNDIEIIRVMVRVLTDYMERYSDASGSPVFPGGSYIQSPPGSDEVPTTEQRKLELVDSYSMSVTLTLSTIGFLQVLRTGIRNDATLRQIDRLQELASRRLTAAMTALLRSFSVRVFDYDSDMGRHLCSMINQQGEPDRVVAERLSESLTVIRSRLREELSIGSGVVADELDNPFRLFECGWSWGVVENAAPVAYTADVVNQAEGIAEDRPYLYFTGIALDGIEDLFTRRTRILGLLDETQQKLAQALQLRWELTLAFWNRVATFNETRWPVEDVPWRTTDGIESDYYSLFISSMVAQSITFGQTTGSSSSLVRLGNLLSELASRGRITRRPVQDDPALGLHAPGARLQLNGTERMGRKQTLIVASYAPLLLKRVVRLASLVDDSVERDRLSALADRIWEHVVARQMENGLGEGLWDDPANILPVEKSGEEPSWYHTQRVVECLVASAWAMDAQPRVSDPLMELAREYLVEAEHLFDQQLLYGRPREGHSIRTTFQSIEAHLQRARGLLHERPGTACVLAQQVLADLDKLYRARSGTFDQD